MRGHVSKQQAMFVVVNLEEKVPADHPLRAIKGQADAILAAMRKDLAAAYCSNNGRPGIPPEQLLKAMLLRALYSIRSEIQLMQVIDYNMLYRWFLDLPLDAKVWTPEAFSVNRDRFEQHGLVRKFFDRIVAQAYQQDLASSDHFTVDGTLIRSWASDKSLVPRDPSQTPASERTDDDPGNPTVNFHNQKRSNATHVSTSDPEARLARKGSGKEAHLSHSGHVLMENRHGLVLDVQVEPADGTAERRAAQAMLKRVQRRHGQHPRTLGADTGYDDGPFLLELEQSQITPHVPLRDGPIVSTDEPAQARRRMRRRMASVGYAISQKLRKRVEEIFGWCKTIGGLARSRLVGRWKIAQEALVVAAAYNLLRMTRLQAA
jgi:transposase